MSQFLHQFTMQAYYLKQCAWYVHFHQTEPIVTPLIITKFQTTHQKETAPQKHQATDCLRSI